MVVLDVVHAVLRVLALALQQLEALFDVVGGHAVHGLVRAVFHELWAHALEEVHGSVAELADLLGIVAKLAVLLFLRDGSNHGHGHEEGKDGEQESCTATSGSVLGLLNFSLKPDEKTYISF